MGALLHAKSIMAAAELHHHLAVVAFVIFAVTLLLFRSVILSLDFLGTRQPAEVGTAAAAPTDSRLTPRCLHFFVLCLAMAAVLHAEPLVDAAAGLRLYPGVVACVVLAIAALFHWAILSISFSVDRRSAQGETNMLLCLRPTGTAAAKPTGSASKPQCPHFLVLCLATGALLHAEPLVDAAADLRFHPAVVVCVVLPVAALFHWAILSLNFRVARRQPAERRPKMLLRPTDPAASTFLAVAALMSASWFVETFAAAAELRLPKAAAVVTNLFFAALFNVSLHLFRSFFVPRPPPAAAAAQWEGVGAIAVAVMGIAGCLAAACGSATVYPAARS